MAELLEKVPQTAGLCRQWVTPTRTHRHVLGFGYRTPRVKQIVAAEIGCMLYCRTQYCRKVNKIPSGNRSPTADKVDLQRITVLGPHRCLKASSPSVASAAFVALILSSI